MKWCIYVDVCVCVCVCDWMRVMAAMYAAGAVTKAWQWAATWNEWHVVSVSGSMAMATPESQHGQHVYGGACSTLMHVYFQLPAVDCSITHTHIYGEYTYTSIHLWSNACDTYRLYTANIYTRIFVMHIQYGFWKKISHFFAALSFWTPTINRRVFQNTFLIQPQHTDCYFFRSFTLENHLTIWYRYETFIFHCWIFIYKQSVDPIKSLNMSVRQIWTKTRKKSYL